MLIFSYFALEWFSQVVIKFSTKTGSSWNYTRARECERVAYIYVIGCIERWYGEMMCENILID